MLPSVFARRNAVSFLALLIFVSCGGAPPSTNSIPTSTPSPRVTPNSSVSSSQPVGVSSPKIETVEALQLQVNLPKFRETAIGYQSPQEQTRHGNVKWDRWTRQCRGKPLHHCPSGLDPNCAPTVINGQQYRVYAQTAAPSFTVSRDWSVIYRGSVPSNWANPPIYTLAVWRNSWVAEVHDEVIIDGQSLNQQMGYSRAFNWVLWHDQPFYFFEEARVTRISYAGVVLSNTYDEVAHNLCCSDARHGIINCSDEISFYAKRGSRWYYVELTFPIATE